NSNLFDNKLLYLKNIFIDSQNRIFITSGYNSVVYYFENFQSNPVYIENSSTTLLQDFIEIDSVIYGANNTGIVVFNDSTFVSHINFPYSVTTFKNIRGNIYVGTDNGLCQIVADTIQHINIRNLSNNSITAINQANDTNYIWIGTYNGLNYVSTKNWETEFEVNEQDGLPGNEIAINGLLTDAIGMMWVGTLHGIATYDIKKKSETKFAPDCRIETIVLNGNNVGYLPIVLKHNQNNFIFELSGLSFKNEQSIVYDYYLRGKNKIYTSSSGVPYKAAYQNLPSGKYSFLYRAKGKDGIWSYYHSLEFTILKPFWLRWWFILGIVLVLAGSVFVMIRLRERQLKAKNEELERMVLERTWEIEQQKTAIEAKNAELEQQQEEIIVQRDEIMKQRDVAEKQRDAIAQQQEEIMDSIYYAKRIQAAILPPKQFVQTFLPEHFILYLPRDIVSGDFYWIKHIKDEIVVVAADCTGHGVPGAFMSMLGSALLDEIVLRASEEISAGRMLDELRTGIVNALHQTGKVEEAKDGMDLALYKLNPKKKTLQFSGAFNPLYIVRDEEIIELKADRKPIGIFEEVETPFTTHYFTPQKGDLFYTFSDGYASQFGGPNGKKFKFSRFQKLFLTIKDKPMDEQKATLDKILKNWMGVKYEQIDDIIVIGVKYIWD
ncbi:MAG: SpoIIE family protein phosphatase, partial [Bacteroidales bacterium]|nr:SpoIIE family protein phosphatase [Bacteroidales bacterium]